MSSQRSAYTAVTSRSRLPPQGGSGGTHARTEPGRARSTGTSAPAEPAADGEPGAERAADGDRADEGERASGGGRAGEGERAGATGEGTRGGVPLPAPVPGQDLRGSAAARTLCFLVGDRVVVSGLPGSGKSTLIRRAVALEETVRRVDSQETRERWAARMPRWLPYAAYRPLVRIAHYAGLRAALASGASLVVHDCGNQRWVRDWIAADSRRRGRALHLVLLDVPPSTALHGQRLRGRGVSGYAFVRHRRAIGRLVAQAEAGRLPRGCASVVLLDREAAEALRGVVFE